MKYKMQAAAYHKNCLAKLYRLRNDFSLVALGDVRELLEELSHAGFKDPLLWKKYYSILLFLLAYPGDEVIYQAAARGISRMERFLEKDKALSRRLFNSGLPGTALAGCFSYQLNRSFLDDMPERVSLHSVDGDKELIMQFLNTSLSGIEKEMLSEEVFTWSRWIGHFAGPGQKDKLEFFIRQVKSMPGGMAAREAVFSVFKLYSRIALGDPLQDIRQYQAMLPPVHCHEKGLMKVSGKDIFKPAKKDLVQVDLSTDMQEALLRLAQKTLYSLFKETDPFTFAQVGETEFFHCGRGTGIALFYMMPEKKLELECYCGYLLLKNGVAVAYGGGWILGRQCRFGLNVLPDFRGGESALLCTTVMRLFVSHFNAGSLVIEPFQLGKGNDEGIRSASFWFYYRMGFRPKQPLLARLAAAEQKKIKATARYRCSADVLRKLSHSVMVLQAGGGRESYYDIGAISLAVTALVREKFRNNREEAERHLAKKYPTLVKHLPFSVMLLLDAEEKAGGPHLAAGRTLGRLFASKPLAERQFVLGMQQQEGFLKRLQGF